MNNQTLKKTTDGAKFSCLIEADSSELSKMISAILDGQFRFVDGGTYDLLIRVDADAVILSSSDSSGTAVLFRPITADTLLATASELMLPKTDLRFTADPETYSALLGDISVKLTKTEFRLYSAILENGDSPISAEDLSKTVWGQSNRNLCAVYISYLRRKLNAAFGDGSLITVSGKGYRLRGKNK